MYWINFLHLYQPPTMERETIEKVSRESYDFIIKRLEENPKFGITLNICGSLLEQLEKCGEIKIIERLRGLVSKNQVELTGSAAFHAFLPLVPEDEVVYQIRTNEAINKKFFGDFFKPSGFFIPEMAYSKKIAKIISGLGYKWLILDEIHLGGSLGNVNFNKGYSIQNTDLKVLFRKRDVSKSYVPTTILHLLKNEKTAPNMITATDGELYGHHHKDEENHLNQLINHPEVEAITVSAFLKKLKTWEEVEPKAASWESTEKELKNKEPYILWNNSKNSLQQKIWRLAFLALKAADKHKNDENHGWARHHLNNGLASCTFWWAAGHDFRDSMGPISWNPDEIEKGVDELIRSVRALERISRLTKIRAESLYIRIKKMIWEKHWKFYWKK